MQLNAEQNAAVSAPLTDNILLIAGAGTGKTRTLISRAVELTRQGVPHGRILLLTFTRKAANEMLERLEDELEGREKIWAGTFHRFCLDVARRRPASFDMENVRILDADDQVALVKMARGEALVALESIDDGSEELEEHMVTVQKFLKERTLLNYLSYARNSTISYEEYLERYTGYEGEIADTIVWIFHRYEALKRERGYLDYDDILVRVADALHSDGEVRAWIKSLYDHILVDEMQDTNPLQWRILDGLRAPATLFCVGDDAQSIYAFRGADIENMRSFNDRVPRARVLKLVQNYRSTQPILNLSNWLLDGSPLKYDKKLVSFDGRGGPCPTLLDFDSEYTEAHWVVNQIQRRQRRGIALAEQMVLARSAFAARAVEAVLIDRRLPYVFTGGVSILQSAHVKDLVSALHASISHRDDLAWLRFLCLFRRVGEKSAMKVIRLLESAPFVEDAPPLITSALPKNPEIAACIQGVRAALPDPYRALRVALDHLEPRMKELYKDWKRRRRDIGVLLEVAQKHQDAEEFLANYTLDPTHSSALRDQDDAVQVMTVHAAKGMEARVVYLIQANPGNYPHRRAIEEGARAVEEERRIFYVALTRPMEELFLTRAETRRGGPPAGGFDPDVDSYFLAAVPDELIDRSRT